MRTTRTFLRDCSVASPMALLLFGGALQVLHEAGAVLVDGWLRIRAPAPTAVLVKQLRAALDSLLAAKVLCQGALTEVARNRHEASLAMLDALVAVVPPCSGTQTPDHYLGIKPIQLLLVHRYAVCMHKLGFG